MNQINISNFFLLHEFLSMYHIYSPPKYNADFIPVVREKYSSRKINYP